MEKKFINIISINSIMFSLVLLAGIASATTYRTATINIKFDNVANSTCVGIITGIQHGADSPIVYEASLVNLEPNSTHGWHVHSSSVTNQNCSQAGGHYNPFGTTHGAPDASQSHAGDYGNFDANADGIAKFTFSHTGSSLYGENAITTQAIVIHAGKDDLGQGGNAGSLASGNAGARLACGNFEVEEISTHPSGPRVCETCAGMEIHCVKSGDTLSKISKQYKLDLPTLEAANPQFADNFDLIYPGDKVCIPEACYPSRKPAKCDGELLTKIKLGDTLYKLAMTNGFSLADLIAANPQLGPNFDLIFPHDEVCKPTDCGDWDVEEEYEEEKKAKFECVVEYNDAVEGETVGVATYSGNSDAEDGYEASSKLKKASASSMVASIVLVLGAVAMFAI
jgi:Cu-Zn family superoxide dismutase